MDDNSNGEVLNYWYVNGGEFQSGCFFQLQCLGVSWLGGVSGSVSTDMNPSWVVSVMHQEKNPSVMGNLPAFIWLWGGLAAIWLTCHTITYNISPEVEVKKTGEDDEQDKGKISVDE